VTTYANSFMRPNPHYIWSKGPVALAFAYHFDRGFERYELRLIFRRKHTRSRQLVLGLSEWQAIPV
jgi:hypothetical protein